MMFGNINCDVRSHIKKKNFKVDNCNVINSMFVMKYIYITEEFSKQVKQTYY